MTSFMNTYKDEYLKYDKTNQNHVKKFVSYLSLVQKDNRPADITQEDVDSCIGYYAKLEQINSINSLKSHLDVFVN